MAPSATMTPNPLGVRFTATWHEDCTGWQLERHSPSEQPVSAETYVATLPTCSTSPALAAFLAHPGPMAVFELECDGVRKAVGVKLAPWGTNPVLVRQTLTARTLPQELAAVHPVLARQGQLTIYHWDTPGFCDLCDTMGLDPDRARPRFRAAYQELARELLRWSCTVAHSTGGSWESPQGEARMAAHDLLALMRADLYPDPGRLDELRRRWDRVDQDVLPRFDEFHELVNSDALLDPASLDAGVARPPDPPLAALDFLPSRHGSGHCATISGYWGRHEPDGWVSEDYADLHGILVEPDGDTLWEQTWLRTAVRHLREQDTLLVLSTAEAQMYLASDEAAYWVWREGGTARWPQVRRPTLVRRLLWRMWPPRLPRDRELAGRSAKQAPAAG